MYGIIDCDNCYCSCEKVFRPDLEAIKNVLQGKDIDVVPATKSLRLDDERKIKSDDNKGA